MAQAPKTRGARVQAQMSYASIAIWPCFTICALMRLHCRAYMQMEDLVKQIDLPGQWTALTEDRLDLANHLQDALNDLTHVLLSRSFGCCIQG
jgi:hypothetical protein